MTQTSRMLALGLAMAASVGMSPAPVAFEVSPGISVSAPSKNSETRTVVNAHREETERVRELLGDMHHRRHRLTRDGQHRSPGDRAHKRWKRARASGRR